MKQLICIFNILVVIGLVGSVCAADAPASGAEGRFIKYSISGQTIEIVSSVTPYDSNQKTRDSFLEWFKRGFETVLNGRSPLMIEWQNSDSGRAGRKGYDLGMDEAERYLKRNEPNQSLQTIPIPPG